MVPTNTAHAGAHTLRCSLVTLVAAIALGACGAPGPTANPPAPSSAPQVSGHLTLYTSVTQDTVDAVLAGFRAAHPAVEVDVFRALTGQVNTRLATEEQTGGIKADVVWQSDPLSMQPLAARGRFLQWSPAEISVVPTQYRAPTFFGTRLLTMALVVHRGVDPAPASWSDLTRPEYQGAVAIPNPAAAGTAFGALGYFSQASGYGLDYYRKLRSNGAVQVQTINDVITGVAQGRYKAGMTLDTSARQEVAKGSPIDLVYPRPGGISIFSPVAVITTSGNVSAAKSLVDYLISADGQRRIATTGWQPVRKDVPGPAQPEGAHVVAPDWTRLYDRQQKLLDDYRQIFGG